jgi:hypothetical protein
MDGPLRLRYVECTPNSRIQFKQKAAPRSSFAGGTLRVEWLKPFSVWGILILAMAWTGKWRNFLALWLAFAVSPISISAQTVCELSCFFHETTVSDSRFHSPRGHEALTGSAERSAGMHCHKLSDSVGARSGVFVHRYGVCHGDNCFSTDATGTPATPQSKLSNAPAQEIRMEARHAIPLAAPAVAERHRPRSSCVRFREILASGTLRI